MHVEATAHAANEHHKRMVYAILLAQLLSVVLAVTGVSSAALAAQDIYAPTVQAFLAYCLLAIAYGSAQLLLPSLQRLLVCWHGGKPKRDTAFSSGRAETNYSRSCSARSTCTLSDNSCIEAITDNGDSFRHVQPGCDLVEGSSSPCWRRLRQIWLPCAALALIDVEANVLVGCSMLPYKLCWWLASAYEQSYFWQYYLFTYGPCVNVPCALQVVKAYRYTSLTSVTLLDCFTIPSVMILSWLVLHSRYKAGHVIGAALCISGLAVLVLGDARQSHAADAGNGLREVVLGQLTPGLAGDMAAAVGTARQLLADHKGHSSLQSQSNLLISYRAAVHTRLQPAFGSISNTTSSSTMSTTTVSSAGSAPLLGDILVLLGALLYSVCNVTQELLLSDMSPSELLAGIGMFGALLSGVQGAVLGEWQALVAASAFTRIDVFGPMLGFACAMLCFYSFVPQVLILGGATVLNISLLSSDAWAALARFLWFGGFQGWSAYFFLGSLCLVGTGIVVYALSGSPKQPCSNTSSGAVSLDASGLPRLASCTSRSLPDGSGSVVLVARQRSDGITAGGYSALHTEGDVEDSILVARQQRTCSSTCTE